MDELSGQYLTTAELARLLRVKERKVYELAATGEVPCSRATGKLLFPRHQVESWVASRGTGMVTEHTTQRPQVFAGSHDPLLEWALRESRSGLASYFDGSLDGLRRFCAGEAIAAGLHVHDPGSNTWNLPLVSTPACSQGAVLVEFAWRDRGLMVAPQLRHRIDSVAALAGCRVAVRQPGAGSQALLEQLLSTAGLSPDHIDPVLIARTETDAAQAVAEGKADAALGLRGVALQLQLEFVPLLEERFDLLVHRRSWFEPPLQRLLAFCRSPAFEQRAGELKGYDASGFGTVHFNGA